MSSNSKLVASQIPNPFQSTGNVSIGSIPSATAFRHESQIPMPSFSQPTVSSSTMQDANISNLPLRRRNSVNSTPGLSNMINNSINKQTNLAQNTNLRKRSRTTMMINEQDTKRQENTRRRSLPSRSNNEIFTNPDRKPSRYSNLGLAPTTDFLRNESQYFNTNNNNNNSTLSSRDTRPLRDRNFQQAIQEEIINYLIQNKFDIETNHPVSIKSLKQPTQKGFLIIFKWLYQRVDPGHKFNKSIESDVYQILKNLQYPYLESINKSQISAVGGSSWHKFLGMLHWLVRVNMKLDQVTGKMDDVIDNQPTQEMVSINKPVKTLDEQNHIQEKYELMVENLFINYITESYKNFLNVDDNYEVPMEKLSLGFEKFTHIIESDVYNLNSQNEKYFRKYQYVQKISERFTTSMEKFNALKNDLEKFKKYIDSMEIKSQEWPKKLKKMNEELMKKNDDVSNIETNIREILKTLDSKGLSVETIDDRNKEKTQLLEKYDTITDNCDKLTGIIKAKKYENNGLVRNLVSVQKQYELSLERFFHERAETFGLKENDETTKNKFQVKINESKLTNVDESIQVKYSDIFDGQYDPSSTSLLESQKEEFQKLLQEINLKSEKLNINNNIIKDQILELQDEIKLKNVEYQKREKTLSELKSQIVSQKQKNESNLVIQRIELEELQNRNQKILKDMERRIKDAENQLQEKERELETWKLNAASESAKLKQKTQEIIGHSIDFKTTIEKSITTTKEDILKALQEIKEFKSSKQLQK
ncbi:similar to Saccharomyces cerevisiae YIL144W TID3 Component of the evolutionarily conserved kinetochore-associated Ndc80 complex (Ndc80p-Nuf2p-Spc24p-Spc25p) [Maudiozyma saulgeensis]|uniref:Kinetochore protein NDC80 n=1 Tax=Maudiozyma saulgeensis TaxID=1789683 RepID=A0A1X7QWU4_9SACH|nr:similar to Saccharomyces cerevisiae YIL144W TID3 Component of the evolutionarily conserved kinetochore-associated Ndc80 complex (Ndc80p-Nuf2p-Spc24p-Spc25p) [Kazachstania saulgeensis]